MPFTRDWDEEVDNLFSKSINKAEPDVTAGHAIIVNKMSCPGKEPEFIFRVDQTHWVLGKATFGTLKFAGRREMHDVRDMREDQRPKWLPQVLARIERLAETNENARAFVEFNKQSAQAKNAGIPTIQ